MCPDVSATFFSEALDSVSGGRHTHPVSVGMLLVTIHIPGDKSEGKADSTSLWWYSKTTLITHYKTSRQLDSINKQFSPFSATQTEGQQQRASIIITAWVLKPTPTYGLFVEGRNSIRHVSLIGCHVGWRREHVVLGKCRLFRSSSYMSLPQLYTPSTIHLIKEALP